MGALVGIETELELELEMEMEMERGRVLVIIADPTRMATNAAAVASILGAESLLALMPIAIKQTPLSPLSTIWSRIGVSAILGGLLMSSDRRSANDIRGSSVSSIAALGALNLAHVTSSFESFRHLPAGAAMALLYTYPLWIVLLDWSGTKETIGWMSLATVGAGLISLNPGVASVPALHTQRSMRPTWGVFMGVVMAFTEAAMYTLLRTIGWTNPATSVWAVNASAAVWLALATLFVNEPATSGETVSDTTLLAAFNGVVTFGGYWLRFYAVPRLAPVTYAYLSYAGIIAAFLWGLLFLGEKPGLSAMVGAALILVSGMGIHGRVD